MTGIFIKDPIFSDSAVETFSVFPPLGFLEIYLEGRLEKLTAQVRQHA